MPRGIGYGRKARGRGRGQGGGIERLPGGNLPRSGRMPKGMPGPGGRLPQGGGAGNGGTTAPAGRGARGRGQGKGKGGGKMGIGGAALPGPGGRQLAARVASGAITQEQAQRTMQQRRTLQKAFGKNWREKIAASAGGKTFAEVNKGLKANPKDPKLVALRKKLLAGRKAALELARAKNKGEGKKTEEDNE